MLKIQTKIRSFAVAQPDQAPPQLPPNPSTNGIAERRLRFDVIPKPAEESLRFIHRPNDPTGHDGRIYLIDAPEGAFSVTVVQTKEGEPFEVWLQGDKMPRGLESVAKNLSLDMRSIDRGFLLRKLEALKKVEGERFQMLCPDGVERRMKGAIEAFATVVEHRLRELGCFTPEVLAKTPMLDAMISQREPECPEGGGPAWHVPVHNTSTDDKFMLFIREGETPNGQVIPISIWFAGRLPRSFEGIQKLLSIDMRIVDPYWIGRKLTQLTDLGEKNAEFWAPIPGSEPKQRCYPSTLAYVADVLLNWYAARGLLARDGRPLKDNGVVQLALFRHREDAPATLPAEAGIKGGTDCASCSAIASCVLLDGCRVCTQCAASHCG